MVNSPSPDRAVLSVIGTIGKTLSAMLPAGAIAAVAGKGTLATCLLVGGAAGGAIGVAADARHKALEDRAQRSREPSTNADPSAISAEPDADTHEMGGATRISVADPDSYRLVMRRTESALADGSFTTVVEIFSEELALRSLRGDPPDNTESGT